MKKMHNFMKYLSLVCVFYGVSLFCLESLHNLEAVWKTPISVMQRFVCKVGIHRRQGSHGLLPSYKAQHIGTMIYGICNAS